jgi:acetyl esterase/lipase
MNLNYAGSREALLRAFPGCGTLAGLPPTFLVDADRDSLRASGQLFASQLLAAGVQVRRVVICGSRHAFLNSPGKPLFREGIEVMVGAMANGITG